MRPKGSLQALINPGTEFEWTTYAFAGNDPLEVALQPGYFDHWAEILMPGDLILFGCGPARRRRGPPSPDKPVPIRRALLMVLRGGGREARVKLVQDWGGVDVKIV